MDSGTCFAAISARSRRRRVDVVRTMGTGSIVEKLGLCFGIVGVIIGIVSLLTGNTKDAVYFLVTGAVLTVVQTARIRAERDLSIASEERERGRDRQLKAPAATRFGAAAVACMR